MPTNAESGASAAVPVTQPDVSVHSIESARRLLSGTIAQRLIRGVGWSIFGGVVASASSLLAAIMVARMLGPEKYGALGLIQSTLNTFIIFVAPAVGLTATKFVAELRHRKAQRAGRILGLTFVATYVISTVLALGLFLGADALANGMYHAPFLAPLLRISALALLLSGFNGAQTGALAGLEAFDSIAVANLVKGLTTFPLMWFGTRYFGINGAVVALACAAAIGCLACEILLRRALRAAQLAVSFRNLRPYAGLLFSFSLPAMLTSGMVLLAMWLGNVWLVRQPDGYAQFGIFNAANQWRAAILFLPTMVVQPFLPMLSKLAGEGNYLHFRKSLLVSIAASSLAALLPSVVVLALSAHIMRAYGAGFSHARAAMMLVVVATLLAAPSMAIIQAMNSLGRLWSSAAIHFIWVLAFLGVLSVTVHSGATGLAVAYVLSYLLQLILFGGYFQTRVHVAALKA